jgi:hypothetical protein
VTVCGADRSRCRTVFAVAGRCHIVLKQLMLRCHVHSVGLMVNYQSY